MAGARRRPLACPSCGGRANHVRDVYRDGSKAAGYLCRCGFLATEDEAAYRIDAGELNLFDDGRIRGPDDVPIRIAAARARREADSVLAGRQVARELHELYCETAELHSWVEVMAADSWAEVELTRRLGRKVHRTQVRRERLMLEELGYVRRLGQPRSFALRGLIQEHKSTRRTKPPMVLEVLKAKEA